MVMAFDVVKQFSPNFAFLAHHDPRLAILASQAEQQFSIDPSVTLMKLRIFAETLAKVACAKLGLYVDSRDTLETNVDRLAAAHGATGIIPQIFHEVRRGGNAAAHGAETLHREALHQLQLARQLAIWFQRSFGNNRKFDPGPFIPPVEPKDAESALQNELAQLRNTSGAQSAELARAAQELEMLRLERDAENRAKLTAEQLAAKASADAALWEALATEEIASNKTTMASQIATLQAELAAMQARAIATPAETKALLEHASAASDAVHLDEAATRVLIDRQLRAAGWEVDSTVIRYSRGVRPTKGKNLAIAEWPTNLDGKSGFSDYVLFVGLTAIAVIEAKKQNRDVVADLGQAKRYSRGYQILADESLPDGSPWGAHAYRVPFLFATNGRPYLRQLETKSGVWFRDARKDSNHARALQSWYTPAGLVELLQQDAEVAQERLAHEPMAYIDRDYQRNAILAVEQAIGTGRREMLVAMATGTGKTRTCIGLCYRLLKTRRFRRILFLVDRRLLGEQTLDALKDFRLENLQTFFDIYNVKELKDIAPDPETRFHIATVQAMTMRVLGPHGDIVPPPIDSYDCIVIDECHRGYLLDREMSDHDFEYRDEADYISKYRRVLDYFDAVKIGLTATPALHTKEIFGAPVYTYSYREAVIDGFLVDYEPPIQIITQLAHDGIHYQARQQALVFHRATNLIAPEELPDEVSFEVENFNRQVITENFNRAVLHELVQHIDPETPEKTLIFAVTDQHADLVVTLLKQALAERYGAVDDDAVMKITGTTDRVSTAMRQFRNERHPNIVVTVDLLTTGIDVPTIGNLVFLRRVGSRILYEQMIGRATRLCDKYNKERFRIFDAADLYSSLQSVSDMKPVVVNPSITFTALALEISKAPDDADRQVAIDQFIAKLQRKRRHLKAAEQAGLETAAGMNGKALIDMLRTSSPAAVAHYFSKHTYVAGILDRVTQGDGSGRTIISEHADSVREVVRGYGVQPDGSPNTTRPDDYLESFRSFLLGNMNKLPALIVVTQRPRELTRESLRELKLLLDQAGFGETALQTAWREAKNEDIVATIIGHIRRAAIGSPLLPYTERVDRAVVALRKSNKFTTIQAQWLTRIAKQIKVEAIVDRTALDRGEFKSSAGGFTRLNKIFDGKLEALLGELADEVWRDAG
jgi:type I restriction enzyme, R subunit